MPDTSAVATSGLLRRIRAVPGGISGQLRGIRHPEAFHGERRPEGFFEGWYVKCVSADQAHRYAVIPGIFRSVGGASVDEAFVQVLDGSTGGSEYHRFEVEEFEASSERFEVRVGDNHFGPEGVRLALPGLRGEISYVDPLDPWPVTWRRPGIMGWYAAVPFMECYHGVVSFGHGLRGSLERNGTALDFNDGRGYIEKDWGRAFPAGYVWMHSNHFVQDPGASLIASVAIIPWIRTSFRGFIIGLKHSGRLHQWATYNRSRERTLTIDDSHVHWVIDGPDGRLELSAERVRGGLLHAPLRTAMHQRVEETLDARITTVHRAPGGRLLMRDEGVVAGMEVFGEIERLLATRGRRPG